MLRWQIGEATVTSVVEMSSLTSPSFLFEGVDKAAVAAMAHEAGWLVPHFVTPSGLLPISIQCLVIEVGDHTIAVDTCVGNDKPRAIPEWHERQGSFLDDMAGAGFPPESVTEVVCTHLHTDHVGWNTRLVDGVWVPTFSHARHLLVRAEYDHWERERGLFGDDVFADSIAPLEAADMVDLVDPTHRICEQVWLESTPGHTPGHVSVRIESAGAKAVITGDMVHTPIQMLDPELALSFDTDQASSRRTRHEAFARWADGDTMVIGTHFAPPGGGTLHAAGGDGFRLEPGPIEPE